MEIEVIGKSLIKVKPDTLTIYFRFEKTEKSYEKVFESGLKQVEETLNKLRKIGFKKEDFKTQQFQINKNKIFNEETKTYQEEYNFFQIIEVMFPYDVNKMNNIMRELTKVDSPSYNIEASLKHQKKYEVELFEIAFKDAKSKAEILAKINHKKLKECEEIKEIDTGFLSPILLKAESDFQTTYNSSDITIEKQIKTEWEAE